MGIFLRRCAGVIMGGMLALVLAGVAAAQHGGTGMGGMNMPMAAPMTDHMAMPRDLDTATSKMTDHGRYRAGIAPEAPPVRINRIHRWILSLRTPDGKPVANAVISVDGGMPAHGHGLPTAPRVTKYLGDGRYLVDGMKFNMAGWWQLRFAIAGDNPDSVTFNMVLK